LESSTKPLFNSTGDAATLSKRPLYGQMSGRSQMVNAFKTGQTKLIRRAFDKGARGGTAVITGKADVKGTLGGKYQRPNLFTRSM
jgi:hypothetical protein